MGLHKIQRYDIPLTEEWLQKLGFVNVGIKSPALKGYFSLTVTEYLLLLSKDGVWEIGLNIPGIGGKPAPCPQFKYVHQVQNFYYLYKGEELIIN